MNMRTLITLMALVAAPAAAHLECHQQAELAGVRIQALPLRYMGHGNDYLGYLMTRLDPEDVEPLEVELSICGRTEDVVRCHPQPCSVGEWDGGVARWDGLEPLESGRAFGVQLKNETYGERMDRTIVVRRDGVSSLEMICGLPCKQLETEEEERKIKPLAWVPAGILLGLIIGMGILVARGRVAR